jgi:hypothetical protein
MKPDYLFFKNIIEYLWKVKNEDYTNSHVSEDIFEGI